jgi:hypothetical protein
VALPLGSRKADSSSSCSASIRIGVIEGRTGAPLYGLAGGQDLVLDQAHGRLIVSCDATTAAICEYDLRIGRSLWRITSPDHFVVHAVDEADGLLLGTSSATGRG